MLFNEPKLLKSLEITDEGVIIRVSVLFNEPKLLKSRRPRRSSAAVSVSVLFNEPKLLKSIPTKNHAPANKSFSALQRAEIAEIKLMFLRVILLREVSVLFNEPKLLKYRPPLPAPPVSQIPIPARRRS